jgi:hypothetical protein
MISKRTRKSIKSIADKKSSKQKQDERDEGIYNQGRMEGDRKWIDAVDERIRELEISAGIPELRKLKAKTMYKWK